METKLTNPTVTPEEIANFNLQNWIAREPETVTPHEIAVYHAWIDNNYTLTDAQFEAILVNLPATEKELDALARQADLEFGPDTDESDITDDAEAAALEDLANLPEDTTDIADIGQGELDPSDPEDAAYIASQPLLAAHINAANASAGIRPHFPFGYETPVTQTPQETDQRFDTISALRLQVAAGIQPTESWTNAIAAEYIALHIRATGSFPTDLNPAWVELVRHFYYVYEQGDFGLPEPTVRMDLPVFDMDGTYYHEPIPEPSDEEMAAYYETLGLVVDLQTTGQKILADLPQQDLSPVTRANFAAEITRLVSHALGTDEPPMNSLAGPLWPAKSWLPNPS